MQRRAQIVLSLTLKPSITNRSTGGLTHRGHNRHRIDLNVKGQWWHVIQVNCWESWRYKSFSEPIGEKSNCEVGLLYAADPQTNHGASTFLDS